MVRTHSSRSAPPKPPYNISQRKPPRVPERRIGYPGGLFALLWKEGKTIEQQKNRFTDAEMEIAKETDLPDLLESLGYQVRRVGSYHTTKEMDSLRIKTAAFVTQRASVETPSPSSSGSAARASRRRWNICLTTMAGRGIPPPLKSRCRPKARTDRRMSPRLPLPCHSPTRISGACLPIFKKGASRPR